MDSSRVAYWEKKLRPIRLDAEPVELQLARKLNGTVVITGVTGFTALIMGAIFAAFGRVDVGLKLAGLSFVAASLWYWFDFVWARMWALAYIRERGEPSSNDAPPG